MNREKSLDSIPIDLFLEIFSRLPTKSVGRCRCVSKLWKSLLGRQDFTELFLTKSSTRPRLLFAVKQANDEWLFYSSPHPQNPYEKSTVVTADFHTKFFKSRSHCIYASGLFYFPDMRISQNKSEEDSVPVICNPLTGQYVILPKPRLDSEVISFLGFDPIDKQFKVLLINTFVNNETFHHILTLGAGKMKWRKIQYCPFTHRPHRPHRPHRSSGQGICINGVLYYLAQKFDAFEYMIVCFDVRAEKFRFIDGWYIHQLINYKGKLGGINLHYEQHCEWSSEWHTRELQLRVLEDVEKQEWSKYVYPFLENGYCKHLSVVGMTMTSEIVLSENWGSRPYNVFYFNPERNTFQCVKLQGVGAKHEKFNHCGIVYAYVDHVEDLSVNDAKQLKSSIYAQDRCMFESINKFDALCRLDEG